MKRNTEGLINWIDNLEDDNEQCEHNHIEQGKCTNCGITSTELYEATHFSEEADDEDFLY